MTMRAKEGIGAEWSLRGIAWRASPDRSVWVGELEEGASTVVRAALFEPLDGVPKMLAAACGQRNAGRRCRRILVDAAESVSGLGAISDAAAQAMLQEGSARLGVPPDALRIFSAGPLMTLPPVGERLAALDAALASQPLKAPEGFASFPFMMPEGCVEIGFGVWERGGSGARTFFAGLDLGVAPEILDEMWNGAKKRISEIQYIAE